MSVRGAIPILSCLMHSIIRRNIFFRKILPSVLFLQVFTIYRDKSLSLQCYLAFMPLNSKTWLPSSHLYFPGKTLAACPDPWAFRSTKPATPSKHSDGDAEELIDHWHWGETGYVRANIPYSLPDPVLPVASQVAWEPRHSSDSNHMERGAERKQITKLSWLSQYPASFKI